MTPRKPNGYIWAQEINRALRANQAARAAIKRILNEEPGLVTRNFLLAQVATALAENAEALFQLSSITSIKAAAPTEGGSQGSG